MGQVFHLGVDIGSVSTKGVIIDETNNIIASEYVWTQGDPIAATKNILNSIKKAMSSDAEIMSVGTTGSARKLIGRMLEADAVKNEITAHAVGTLSRHPDVRTILEIGGQDSKVILINDGVVTDYAMNTLCAAGTGAFLSSQAKRLGFRVDELGDVAVRSKHPAKIAARCTVFAESDLVHKVQCGHSKEDLVAGLCQAVVTNYLGNVCKGKRLQTPIVFQGGVSKNEGVRRAFQQELAAEILVDPNSHLMGAVGAAILAKQRCGKGRFNFDVSDISFQTRAVECTDCANHCEIILFYRDDTPIDSWGSRCGKSHVMDSANH